MTVCAALAACVALGSAAVSHSGAQEQCASLGCSAYRLGACYAAAGYATGALVADAIGWYSIGILVGMLALHRLLESVEFVRRSLHAL
ncbi:hypothetical protein M885DRAFT_520473 [Pelagophyceae sp. CCMP2097]|nr:hypothetical protein M885DRAFT_520473 [Pelagophyceae sp. CCMP2097]|mmetsp:Transcript_9683/g.34065  ORF Transcript_9683/g.34065 Transcript_9683/m.34065 type:complete len:88 (+) Transcript_9683:391-654(+)